MIISLEPSPRSTKRLRATFDDGRTFDFGLRGGQTYIEHGDRALRANYRARHLANATERRLIENLVPSSSLLAYAILWGASRSIAKNVASLNRAFRKKYKD